MLEDSITKLVDVIRWILILAAVLTTLVLFSWASNQKETCDAPCTVNFPQGTQEDEFRIDWKNEQLKVWKRSDG